MQSQGADEEREGGVMQQLLVFQSLWALEQSGTRNPAVPLEQAVDVEAVAAVGRDPAGRGVRMCEQPEPLELGELVANGRRRRPDSGPLDEVLRAHRLPCGHVLLDDADQDLALALAEIGALCDHGLSENATPGARL